jgi:ABC-type multidrug transport system ATPase subunit
MDEPLACDHVAILREGCLITEDTPERILARGRTRVTIEIRGKTITEEISDYAHELPRLLSRYGLELDLSCVSIQQESLEDIFLKLVEKEEKHG